MAGLVVDHSVSPARSRPSAPPVQWFVLVAVALGLLYGALACAAGLGAGAAHGAARSSAVEVQGLPTAHAVHLAPMSESGSPSTPRGDHGDDQGGTSMAGNHPGMACVVSVDLQFPEVPSASVSDSSETRTVAMSAACLDDVDPPVPRVS